jgi:uncharacterized protein YndB with AHSA1/START domain
MNLVQSRSNQCQPRSRTAEPPAYWAGRVAAQADCDLFIDAPAEVVWQLLTQVDAWPAWYPAVDRVCRVGPLGLGETFSWRSQGFTVTSTIAEWAPARRLAWTGAALGTRAWHLWEIEPRARGVVVRTFECFGGWLPRVMPGAMQRKLEQTLPAWLAALRHAAEGAAAS